MWYKCSLFRILQRRRASKDYDSKTAIHSGDNDRINNTTLTTNQRSIMDTEEILRRVEENNDALTSINIYSLEPPEVDREFARLGRGIVDNTHLIQLKVHVCERTPLVVGDREFFEGLKRNSSIHKLTLTFDNHPASNWTLFNIVGGVGHQILKAYQENNSNLTQLYIRGAYGGDGIVATTLQRCTNLKQISLTGSDITDAQLLPMVEAVREHASLEKLNLEYNRIRCAGCDALATLLEDSNSKLRTLYLGNNNIRNVGATTLANSLSNNTKLEELWLRIRIDQSVEDDFSKLLCKASSVNSTYSSNHTLEKLKLSHDARIGQKLSFFLLLNEDTNKGRVAIKKILEYHPNIDMEPLFVWNVEGEGERDLKALPHVMAWFERAAVAGGSYNVDQMKLSAIYQFARAMPLLFVPASHVKLDNKKRKMDSQ